MRMALGLDQVLHPGVKLDAIRSAFVVAGIMEQGTTRRVAPPEGGSDAAGSAGIYQGLFGRLRAERQGTGNREQGTGPEALEVQGTATPPANNQPSQTTAGNREQGTTDRADLDTIKARVHDLTHPKPEEPYDLMPRSQPAADSEGSPGAPMALPAFGEPVDGLTTPPARRGAGKAATAPGQVLTVEVG